MQPRCPEHMAGSGHRWDGSSKCRSSAYSEQPREGAQDPPADASCRLFAVDLGQEAQCGSGVQGGRRGAFGGFKNQMGRKKQMQGKPGLLWRLREEGALKEGIPDFLFP